jgi:hypothetical protein
VIMILVKALHKGQRYDQDTIDSHVLHEKDTPFVGLAFDGDCFVYRSCGAGIA